MLKRIITFLMHTPIWEKSILLLIFLFGFAGLSTMKTSFFTPIESNTIRMIINYPGASPYEVEQSIVMSVEKSLKQVTNIEKVTSKALENVASIAIEIKKNQNDLTVLQDVKNAVTSITNFPSAVEPPIIYKEPTIEPASMLYVYGNLDHETFRQRIQTIEQDLLYYPEISLITIEGLPTEEILIHVSQTQLKANNITIDQLSMAIKQANFDLTAGEITQKNETLKIRSTQKQSTIESLENIVVFTHVRILI